MSNVVKDHPDWLITTHRQKHTQDDAQSSGAVSGSAQVPATISNSREVHRDWGFDGSTGRCTACRSATTGTSSQVATDSVNAMGEVYKTDFFRRPGPSRPRVRRRRVRAGRRRRWRGYRLSIGGDSGPGSGAVQVRRRSEIYKALLRPERVGVLGVHVELSAMTPVGRGNW